MKPKNGFPERNGTQPRQRWRDAVIEFCKQRAAKKKQIGVNCLLSFITEELRVSTRPSR